MSNRDHPSGPEVGPAHSLPGEGPAAVDRAAFLALLDRHGGDPARWPAAEREAALALIARDETARHEADCARTLDVLLGEAVATAPVDSATVGRLVSRLHGARPRSAERPLRIGFSRRFAFVGAWTLVMCVALGVGLSIVAPVPTTHDTGYGEQELAVVVLGFDPGDLS